VEELRSLAATEHPDLEVVEVLGGVRCEGAEQIISRVGRQHCRRERL
jgi:hypothetical protein